MRARDPCIEWPRARNQYGYGVVRRNGKNYLAHRLALFEKLGISESKLCVLHVCDNPPCVNPDHLFLGTPADNVRDMRAKGRASGGGNPLRGEASPQHKLTVANVLEIRRRRGEPQKKLAKEFGVIQQTISDIQRGRIWKQVGER